MPHRDLALFFLAALGLFAVGCSGDDEGAAGGSPPVPTGSAFPDAAAHCVDKINDYRATLGLPAYARWNDKEACSDGEAKSDSETNQAHGAFGTCEESAQNECPGWSGQPGMMIDGCLEQMWAEGPGQDFNTHGHYINMSNPGYTMASCGFYVTPSGAVWAVQNFK